jgi:hypothetical protein
LKKADLPAWIFGCHAMSHLEHWSHFCRFGLLLQVKY